MHRGANAPDRHLRELCGLSKRNLRQEFDQTAIGLEVMPIVLR
jgi:hypothetical protein